MYGIVVSVADEVSERIGDRLVTIGDWDGEALPDPGDGPLRAPGFELRTFAERHLDTVDAARAFDDPDGVVFVSRHAGDTGPLLTAHFTGNFGPAEHGGADRELSEPCPAALSTALDALDAHAPPAYDVCMECTHHGPSAVGAPSMFVELGSGEEQWTDEAGVDAVARAVLDLRGAEVHSDRAVVAFGGGHYAPRPTRVARETGWDVGHVAADWGLSAMGDPDPAVIDQAFETSRARHALVVGEHPSLADAIDDLGYDVVSETWLRETDGVPLDAVAALEAALCPVDEGLRFGDRADADAFDVVELPAQLRREAQGVDRERVRDHVAAETAAFEATNGGSRVGGRVAVPADASLDGLIDGFADVLREKYDRVERVDGDLRATRSAFDPALAAEAGVPEGPKFGRLAAGEPVEVDGETVPPDAVHETETERFRGPRRLTRVEREGKDN